MDDNRDYIDLRDGTVKRVAGNGPPPNPGDVSAYYGVQPTTSPPAFKGTWIIVTVVSLSATLLIAAIIVVVAGGVLIRYATSEAQSQFEEFWITEFDTESWMAFAQDMEEWGRQMEIDSHQWLIDMNLDDYIIAWTDDFLDGQSWGTFGHFRTWADLVDDISLFLGTSDVRVLAHEDLHLSFDSGGDRIFQIAYNVTDGIIWVTDNQYNPGGTLTIYVPYDWAGLINIHTGGDVYLSEDLAPGIMFGHREV